MNKLIIVVLLVSLLVSCCFKKEIVISRDAIQTMIDKKFPDDHNMVFMRIILMDPKIYFKNTNIGINLLYKGNYLEKEIEGKLDFNGHIRYKKGAFYLDSLEIVEVSMNEKEFSSNGKLNKIILNTLKNYLDNYPVYKLKQSDFKQNLAKLLLQDITVDGDNLKVVVGL
jgi:hypothetical protein